MDTTLQSFIEQSSALHRHLCPRQILGIRMGIYAGQLLNLNLPQTNKRLFCFIETDGCFADGVSVATGCWLGRRTMRLIDYGKVAASFVDTETGQAIRIWPHPNAREQAVAYAPEERSRWHSYLAAYQVMPSELLLSAAPIELQLDLKALIGRNGRRSQCERCGEEIINQREVQQDGETLCVSCANGGYFAMQNAAPEGAA